MAQILERTVLFADLRGSTSLYETLGNADATTVVTQSVSLLAGVVMRRGGAVVKTLGDGLMAVFADARDAVAAADEMHDSLQAHASHGTWPAAFDRHLPLLRLQVALAQGEVVEMGGDCFGDAVNVAARLLDHREAVPLRQAEAGQNVLGQDEADRVPDLAQLNQVAHGIGLRRLHGLVHIGLHAIRLA